MMTPRSKRVRKIVPMISVRGGNEEYSITVAVKTRPSDEMNSANSRDTSCSGGVCVCLCSTNCVCAVL